MKFIAPKKENLIKTLIHNAQGLSFGMAQKHMRLGNVKVNGKRTKQNIEVNKGDEIEIYEYSKSLPQVPILYKDENVLIVHKPSDIECATRDKSSANTYSLEEIFKEYGAIVVHRLDRLTEGIVILARATNIARNFERYFRDRLVDKFYIAGVHGKPQSEGIKTAFLKKDSHNALVSISDRQKDNYKEIITEFYIKQTSDKYSLLDIKLHTGRTHQIRGYFSHIGNPVIQDDKYGKANTISSNYKGYFLTAYKIKFNLSDELKYLNDLSIEISPTWLQEFENLNK